MLVIGQPCDCVFCEGLNRKRVIAIGVPLGWVFETRCHGLVAVSLRSERIRGDTICPPCPNRLSARFSEERRSPLSAPAGVAVSKSVRGLAPSFVCGAFRKGKGFFLCYIWSVEPQCGEKWSYQHPRGTLAEPQPQNAQPRTNTQDCDGEQFEQQSRNSVMVSSSERFSSVACLLRAAILRYAT